MIQALKDMRRADAYVDYLYELLFEAMLAARYKLNTDYDGLQVVTVWDAKPVAWRPAPFYQFDIGLPGPEPDEEQSDWHQPENLLKEYHEAYGDAQKAKSKFHALYTQAVLDKLKAGEPMWTNWHQQETVTLRAYEVKQVK